MSKNLWIINQYLTTPKLNGDGYRHSYLANHFIKSGYDVTLITSSFSHQPKKDIRYNGLFKVINENYKILLVKGNRFSNAKGIPRILSWVLFCLLLFFIPKRKLSKPDIIVVSSMSLLPVLNVVFYYKIRYPKVKFIFETRDIWPLTIIELGGYSASNIFVKFLAWVEKLGYHKADHLVSVLINADKHITNVLGHNNFRFTWISNGYNLSTDEQTTPLNKSTLAKLPKDKFLIGYAGTLGKANAMEYIVEAMNRLNNEVHLCILGSGSDKKSLMDIVTKDNVSFMDKIPKKEVLPFLQSCDVLYLGAHNSQIYNYGISAQKMFEYMYAGKPILMSGDFEGNIVSLAKCGVVIPAEDTPELCKAITDFQQKNKEYLNELGKNGKEYLLNNFTYDLLSKEYIKVFESGLD
jgi:glycosyltransferase involved in cell wall biosynthesis